MFSADVVFLLLTLCMISSVDFNNKISLSRQKVGNIIAYYMLT